MNPNTPTAKVKATFNHKTLTHVHLTQLIQLVDQSQLPIEYKLDMIDVLTYIGSTETPIAFIDYWKAYRKQWLDENGSETSSWIDWMRGYQIRVHNANLTIRRNNPNPSERVQEYLKNKGFRIVNDADNGTYWSIKLSRVYAIHYEILDGLKPIVNKEAVV